MLESRRQTAQELKNIYVAVFQKNIFKLNTIHEIYKSHTLETYNINNGSITKKKRPAMQSQWAASISASTWSSSSTRIITQGCNGPSFNFIECRTFNRRIRQAILLR